MENLPLEVIAYYETQIRAAAQETGSAALLRNADHLLGLLQEPTRGCPAKMPVRPDYN
jgi:hypothetical protein